MKRRPTNGISPARKAVLTITAAAVLAGLPAAGQVATDFQASIRRTDGGIPHIRAEDWAGLGYGTGYAVAEDNLCLLARNFLALRAELSRYLGPGPKNENLNSDFLVGLLHRVRLFDEEVLDLRVDFREEAASRTWLARPEAWAAMRSRSGAR